MLNTASQKKSLNVPPPPPANLASPPRSISPPQSSLHRKHSRRKSHQILVPPIQTTRKRQGSKVGSTELSGGKTGISTNSNHYSPDGTTFQDHFNDEDEDDDMKLEGSDEVPIMSAKTVTSGATFLIIGQFFTKLVTFAVNQLLLRFVDPGLVGANAQLELLITTILYFSREAIRLASQRQSLSDKAEDIYRFEGGVTHGTLSGTVQEVINIGFIPMIIGIPLSIVLSLFYYWISSGLSQEYAGLAILIFAVASIVELVSEPSFLFFQLQLDFKTRASIESIAVTLRCILIFSFIMLAKQTGNATKGSIIAYALGQFAYSSVLTGIYITKATARSRHKQYNILFVQGVWVENSGIPGQHKIYLEPGTWKLAVSLWLQTFFKHCLTEGDKFLVSILLPIDDQGVYALVVNYGSLIARLCFFPLEEALRGFFSKLLGEKGSGRRKQSDIALSLTVLVTLLRIYLYLGIIAVIFGPLVAPYLLKFLVSPVWDTTTASRVLTTYSCYIPFLAVNGCLEAFVQSVATVNDIKNQSRIMVVFSISFAIVGYIFMDLLKLGAQGLVFANMFNMGLRIIWCVNYIDSFYNQQVLSQGRATLRWLRPCLPNWSVVLTSVLVAIIAYQRIGIIQNFTDLIKMIMLGLFILSSIIYNERRLLWEKLTEVPLIKKIWPSLSISPSSSTHKKQQ